MRIVDMKPVWIIGLLVLASAPRLMAQAESGSQLFENRCAGCHAPGGGGQGPALTGILGRKAGAAAGFDYSPALKASGIVWTGANLDQFLADPSKMVPGTAMPVHITDAAQRAAIIDYLATAH
jgi:cytochrome c2